MKFHETPYHYTSCCIRLCLKIPMPSGSKANRISLGRILNLDKIDRYILKLSDIRDHKISS